MRRTIEFKKYNINARACSVRHKKDEIEVSIITAVDIKNSKALKMETGDFGIVVYNELNFGFMISWKEFEKLQEELKINDEHYEEFLDNFINDFGDNAILISNKKD